MVKGFGNKSMKLTEAIGKEYYIFENKRYTDDDFQKMSFNELMTFKAKINFRITNNLEIIKKFRDKRSYEWLQGKSFAVSVNKKIIPYIKELIRQQYKQEHSIRDRFMDVAKEILPTEDFELILNNAGDMRFRREGSSV